MSDEYANKGLRGTLVNDTATDVGNYPPDGDSTSSGGYGSPQNVDVWSSAVQRGSAPKDKPYYAKTEHIQGFDAGEQDPTGGHSDEGLVTQSLNGGDLRDDVLREEMARGLNSYAGDSFETPGEAKAMLAATSRSPPRKK